MTLYLKHPCYTYTVERYCLVTVAIDRGVEHDTKSRERRSLPLRAVRFLVDQNGSGLLFSGHGIHRIRSFAVGYFAAMINFSVWSNVSG
jgi:hypothetical protein